MFAGFTAKAPGVTAAAKLPDTAFAEKKPSITFRSGV